nr:F-box/LRR-repeat protein 16-like [Nerophis lumbriciformis]
MLFFTSLLFPMLNMSTPSELKSPCVTRNGMVKLPPSQPNGLGSASITKGTPAAKNRLCQSSSVPSILPPPPSSLPYHHHHHLDSAVMPHSAASILGSDLEPGEAADLLRSFHTDFGVAGSHQLDSGANKANGSLEADAKVHKKSLQKL